MASAAVLHTVGRGFESLFAHHPPSQLSVYKADSLGKARPVQRILLLVTFLLLTNGSAGELPDGIRTRTVLNYPDCLELFNDTTSVTLGHHVGGRVLSFQLNGKEALYLDPAESDWKTAKRKLVTAGRFDIGPEYKIPKRDALWIRPWKAKPIGPRAVRMNSAFEPVTGVRLIREFRLSAKGTHLSCRQIIRNESKTTRHWCHWSRTFAKHGGIGIVPVGQLSKFPNNYVMYEGRGLINARPKDNNIQLVDNYLLVKDVPKFPKLGFDSMVGWFAYQMKHDLLFVKKYGTFPNRPYNEVAGLTISIWYPPSEKIDAVELEPIGPMNNIPSGGQAEFTEHWYLLERDYPKTVDKAYLKTIEKRIHQLHD